MFNDTYDLTSSAASGCRSRQETAVLSGREVFLFIFGLKEAKMQYNLCIVSIDMRYLIWHTCCIHAVRLYSMDRPACTEGIIETRTGDNGGKWGWPPTRTEIPMSFSGK